MFSRGTVVIGTGDDDLREGSTVFIRILLRDRPPVLIDGAFGRRFPDRTDTPPIPWSLGPEHRGPLQIQDVERIEVAFSPDRRERMEDDKWWLTKLIVTVDEPGRPVTLFTNTSVNHKFERAGTWSTGVLRTFRAHGTTLVRVLDEVGDPVEGAEVFIDTFLARTSVRAGITDIGGHLLVPSTALRETSNILVRSRIHEQEYYRSHHNFDSFQNWNYRVYRTNVRIDSFGVAHADTRVSGSEIDITVHRDNTLIGLNLLVSVEWDLAPAEVVRLGAIMSDLSAFFYNATDGQFFVEVAQIADRRDAWDDSDFRVFADMDYVGNVPNVLGAFLGQNVLGSAMKMSRSHTFHIYAHEFGHYGFALGDEYGNDTVPSCTGAVDFGTSVFRREQPQASCMMWSPAPAPKICSTHRSNPHVRGTKQGDEACWDTIIRRYNIDSRWNLRQPADRDTIPGRIRTIWSTGEFRSRFMLPTIHRRPMVDLFGLIGEARLIVTEMGGSPINGVVVKTRDAGGSWIVQGSTDTNGMLLLCGLHGGDRLRLEPEGRSAFERDIPSSITGNLVIAIPR